MCSRAEIYEILSLRIGSLAFSDNASRMLLTMSGQLVFIIPAHQNRPLEILEVPLIANMEYERSNGNLADDSTMSKNVDLRLHLLNTGFYIVNGTKNAADQAHITFATDVDCEVFCNALANTLQNLPLGRATPTVGKSSTDQVTGKSRPKKQSHAVMIDLSQDDLISGNTQLLSQPFKAPYRFSTSQRIDLSESEVSSISLTSPLQEIIQSNATPAQPGDNEDRLPVDTQDVHHEPNRYRKPEPDTNLNELEKTDMISNIKKIPELENFAADSVAPACQQHTSQDKGQVQPPGSYLPQPLEKWDHAETYTRTPVASSTLQHLASEALQESAGNPIFAAGTNPDPIVHLQDQSRRSGASGQIDVATQSSIPPLIRANSAKRMGPTQRSMNQTTSNTLRSTRRRNQEAEIKSSKSIPNGGDAAKVVLSEGTAVDWDEDLRTDQIEHEDQSSITKGSKATASRGSKGGYKRKSNGDETVPRASVTKKKAPPKARTKATKKKLASANAGLAAARPQRAAAKKSYKEQSDEDEQSPEVVHQSNDIAKQVKASQHSAALASVNAGDEEDHREMQPLDDQKAGETVGSAHGKSHPSIISLEPAVEILRSNEASHSPIEPKPAPEESHISREGSEAGRRSFRSQEGTNTRLDNGVHQIKELPDVEMVEDSHPLDKPRPMEVISDSRRSFGSTLMDVMGENGMKPIEIPGASEVKSRPFGNKATFANAVKTALQHSAGKFATHASRPDKKSDVRTPSTKKKESESTIEPGVDDRIIQSSQSHGKASSNRSLPHRRPRGGGRVTPLPQTTHPANLIAASDGPMHPSDPSSRPHPENLNHGQRLFIRRDDQPREREKSPNFSTSLGPSEAQKPWAKAAFTSNFLPDKRKRGPPAESEMLQQVKRARKTDPGYGANRPDEKVIHRTTLQAELTDDNPAASLKAKSHNLEPAAQGSRISTHLVQASGSAPIVKHPKPDCTAGKQIGHFEVRSSESTAELPSNSMTPKRQILEGHHLSALTDDHLNRKAQIVGFGTISPRNQGVSSWSSREYQVEQSASVSTEKWNYLPFRKPHTEPSAGQNLKKLPLDHSTFLDVIHSVQSDFQSLI